MRLREVVPTAILVIVALAAVWFHRQREDAPLPSVASVVRVIDGDTIVVADSGGRILRVRLLGMDTPETVDPRKPIQCYGPQASAYTKHLLTGRRVTLRYDRVLHDRYGRVLAYVYRTGPRPLFVDADLVARGYARTLTIPPNTAHAAELARLQAAAALAGRGLWGACGG